ncbi:hypothetical protein ACHAXT_007886 [Thalassiosira profunda]
MPPIDERVVAATVTSIKAALSELDGNNADTNALPSVFTDERVLARPPFAYIHELAKYFSRKKPSLGWATLLVGGDEGNGATNRAQPNGLSRKEKLAFLARLLSVVSRVAGRRLDVLVSPSSILSGREAWQTHDFLRALAAAVMAPEEDMAMAVKGVLEEGDAVLYKRGVRTRGAFVRLQAVVRGRRARKVHAIKSSSGREADATINGAAAHATTCSDAGTHVNLDEEELLQSYQEMLTRKSEVDDQLKAAEARLKRENSKLIRILSLGTKHKTQTSVAPYSGVPRPPFSAPRLGTNNTSSGNGSCRIDEAFRDTISNFSERQRAIKQKKRRIAERESRARQRFAKSKQKEVELKLQEERISDLADKIRKQQMHLKEQKLQFERDKLLEEEARPPETSRPCVMCTEKKIQMREVKAKVRQRARNLEQREAVVVARAQALRKREMEIARREKVVAELEQESQSAVDDLLSEYEEEPAPETQRPDSASKDAGGETSTLPEVRTASNPPRKKGGRKRRRRNPRDGSCQKTDTGSEEESTSLPEQDAEQTLLRASSFGESIPTIVEETDEQSAAEEDTPGSDSAAHSMGRDANGSASSVTADKRIAPTNIDEARARLGIPKKTKKKAQDTSLPRRPSNRRPQHTGTAESRRTSPSPSPGKKRHVFTFERRETQQSNVHRNRRVSSTTAARERDKKPKRAPVREKPDDWTSSFDVQMQCAMNRLKDLV